MNNEPLKLAEKTIIELFGSNVIQDLSPHQGTEPRGNYKNYASRVIRPKSTKYCARGND